MRLPDRTRPAYPARRRTVPDPCHRTPAVREAKDALRLRYANGEISREAYLQGKVELEDLPRRKCSTH